MAKALMIQGTGSGAGKSVIVAGLCRIFKDLGIKVAPFKAQNMALNSFITKEGGEIGRAQAFQAEAAGIEPSNDINPILLKATSTSGCQVILNGKVYGNMSAEAYYAFKDKAWKTVTAAYERLSKKYDLIVIEGAGNPAEINLQEHEIVNMRVARYTDAPVILVGDIDKGGVFASLYGTVELLKDGSSRKNDADYIKAFIINKFRGDIKILRPGLRMIEKKTGKPVIGVIQYLPDLILDEEDGLSIEWLERFKQLEPHKQIKIVVFRLRYISNFTDFAPFIYEPDVELRYSLKEEDINNADLIIIPGSKNTISDLLFLRERGLEECVKSAVKRGTPLIGICGGYQMLGRKIFDPYNVESNIKEIDGMGLLDITTTIERTKTTCQVEAKLANSSWFIAHTDKNNPFNYELSTMNQQPLKGYEIHMGVTTGDVNLFEINRLNSSNTVVLDGSLKDNVWGTYIHGLFDNDSFRHALLNSLRKKKGLPISQKTINYLSCKEETLNKWADVLRNSIDICFILRLLGMESYKKYYCLRHE
jgi:adenosylcobyric acid synthase